MICPEHFSKIFFQQWEQNGLANFYLIKATHPLGNEKLANWVQETIVPIIAQEERTSLSHAVKIFQQQHPDLLVLSPQENKYVLEDFATFFSFLALKKFAYRHRFIILQQVDLLSPIIANKLLKSLEDTPIDTTILFLTATHLQLLPTLESRAVKIHLSFPQTKQVETVHDQLSLYCQKKITMAEIIHSCKGDQQRQAAIFHWALNYTLARHSNYQEKERWLQALKHWSNSIQFNNSSSERLIVLLTQITDGHY